MSSNTVFENAEFKIIKRNHTHIFIKVSENISNETKEQFLSNFNNHKNI